eukprot:CAMPEP_0194696418 /NCGR_PEP_ID=MMETSP0295-20121207/22665_1 /TAXON_ID=39354 /ORGANISM="Heterosigma akashiwo, Strain CCMP2393" /LENGTH=39 /DNA_ID= /DNA_START= /DNA_END= /DNA_ORIENTATION=
MNSCNVQGCAVLMTPGLLVSPSGQKHAHYSLLITFSCEV